MKMEKRKLTATAVPALLACAVLLTGLKGDPLEEAEAMWTWTEPAVYPQPIPGDMDIDTLSVLLDSGNLQWYMPRPEQGEWDAIAGMKIHAPPELVWKTLTAYDS
jgi:hypothetical protein